jgi:hypothetical protein
MKQVLDRDENWIRLHKSKISKTERRATNNELIEYAAEERKAFNLAISGQYSQATDVIRSIINNVQGIDKEDEAWYLQLAASYLYKADRSKAMELQLSAHRNNSYLLRPPEGTSYIKLVKNQTIQSIRVKEFIEEYSEPNAIVLKVNSILENLSFSPESSNQFEKKFMILGVF